MPVTESELFRAALESVVSANGRPPTVIGTRFELGSDQGGDPAVFVTVLLDEATKDEDWTSPKLDPSADRIRALLRGTGTARWPYVRFARPSDLKAVG